MKRNTSKRMTLLGERRKEKKVWIKAGQMREV